MSFTDELLARLPSEIRAKAVTFAIYGHDANQMLVTTHDGECYAVTGFNPEAGVGSGSLMTQSTLAYCFTPAAAGVISMAGPCYASRIELLGGKGVCEVAHSPSPTNNRYVLVRTEAGELFSFGDHSILGLNDAAANNTGTNGAGEAPVPSVNTLKRRSSCIFTHQCCSLMSAHPLLQDKKIVQITCGLNHAACLTSFGEIYAWSIVSPQQPPTGNAPMSPRARSRTSSPSPSHHTTLRQLVPSIESKINGILLSSPHHVTTLPQSQSKLTLQGCIARRRSPFIEIASYQDTIVGLDDDGHMFEWPFNENYLVAGAFNKVVELTSDEGLLTCRQLSSDSLRDVKIVHIAAGRSHCLAVSANYAVYAWGSNDSGQLGLGLPSVAVSNPNAAPNQQPPSNYVASPTRLSFFDEPPLLPMKKIKALTSHAHLDVSICQAVTGDVYIWGDMAVSGFSACTSRPTWTKCKTMAEALQTYGRLAFTPSTRFVDVPYPTLTRSLLQAFDNSEHADIQFVVPGFAPIYAHKQFLQIRSPRFLAAFGSKGWHQGRGVLVSNVEHINYAVVRTFMRFLYTNEFLGIDKAELDVEDYVSLGELAEMCGETVLRKLVCDHIVANCLTVENAAFIYAASLRRPHLSREETLPQACLSFILANLADVVRSESFAGLEGDVAKRILVEAATTKKS